MLVTTQAKDKGSLPMNSTTTLEVLVMDTNDNPPVFTQAVYKASVPENAFGGYQVNSLTHPMQGNSGIFLLKALNLTFNFIFTCWGIC